MVDFNKILGRFKIEGEVKEIKPFGKGNINKTFLVITTENKYMLQSINGYVFNDIDDLMRNIYIVTNHLADKHLVTLEVIKTVNNRIYIHEDDNMYYRVYTYIDDSICHEKVDNPDLVRKLGKAFGRLHNNLSDLDPILIAETIPDFHDTPKRYNNFMDAVKTDEFERVEECTDEIAYIMKNRKYLSEITKALDDGSIPERIVHNDPKINNILFDKDTGKTKCVIDLDTIMPGSCLYDFGDALRSIFTSDNESSTDSSLLKVNLDLYERFVQGYLDTMGSAITHREIELMPASVFILSMELGIRFLEDYLKGDKYFKTSFDKENLIRARNQLALAKDVFDHKADLVKITKKYMAK